jgi:hypothetical protein
MHSEADEFMSTNATTGSMVPHGPEQDHSAYMLTYVRKSAVARMLAPVTEQDIAPAIQVFLVLVSLRIFISWGVRFQS